MKILFIHFILSSMGEYKIPMIMISIVVLVLIAYSVYLKFAKKEINELRYRKVLNTVLVVGSLNLALGMLAQIVGIWDMIAAIKEAADINPEIVMMGVKMTFSTTIYGLLAFVIAGIAWLILSFIPKRK